MSRAASLCLVAIVVAMLVIPACMAFAQQSAPAPGSPNGPAPGAQMQGPGAGPPGMAIPKDLVHTAAPKVPKGGSSPTLWIIAGVVVVAAIVGYVVSRKKGA